MNRPSPRATAACIAMLAALGLLREIWFHTVAEPLTQLPAAAREPRSDARYEMLAALLPPGGAVGYVSDEIVDTAPGSQASHAQGTKLYQQALYALAPRILRFGDDRATFVIANLLDPSRLDEVVRAHGLALVAVTAPGLALARPVR